MESYKRAQGGFDEVLAAVPAAQWDARSACPEWTVRDVAGHVIWAQHQLRAWATGQDYQSKTGFRIPDPRVQANSPPSTRSRPGDRPVTRPMACSTKRPSRAASPSRALARSRFPRWRPCWSPTFSGTHGTSVTRSAWTCGWTRRWCRSRTRGRSSR
ncbi:maleylpyruvate isomerase N-terminal domain-containing protein [Fodinicola feengrottensis]|uniref:maleylpyruvate isomerase N-terminal domain-containing protein n=1 Tax=Fodinicola feengrottensis TaxID=435914 RepID=UPI0036F1ACC6